MSPKARWGLRARTRLLSSVDDGLRDFKVDDSVGIFLGGGWQQTAELRGEGENLVQAGGENLPRLQGEGEVDAGEVDTGEAETGETTRDGDGDLDEHVVVVHGRR